MQGTEILCCFSEKNDNTLALRIILTLKFVTVITKIITTAVIWDSFESEGRSLTCIINCYAYPVIGELFMCEISFLSEVRLINSSRVIVQHFNAPLCYNPFKQGFLLDVWVRDCSLSQTFTRRDSDDGRYRNQGLWNFIEIHPWFILLFISFWRYIQWLEEKILASISLVHGHLKIMELKQLHELWNIDFV